MGETEDSGQPQAGGWPRLAGWAVRSRADLALAGMDSMMAAAAYAIALLLRFDGSVPSTIWGRFGLWLPFALCVVIGTTWSFGLYGQVWRHASAQEARRLLG